MDLSSFSDADGIAAAAATVAVGVSIWANQTAQRTARAQEVAAKVQNDISARMLKIEEAREADRLLDAVKADLVASFTTDDGVTVLRVLNRGNGHANSPSILINGADIFTSELNVFPIKPPTAIGSGAHFDFPWITYDGMHRYYEVALHWQNEDGGRRSWASTVCL